MSTPTTHQLKTAAVYFQRVWSGEKTFEVRYDDRGYQTGDRVVLKEFDARFPCPTHSDASHTDATCVKFSGRQIHARIGFVMASTPARGSQRGFCGNGYVVFSLCNPELIDDRPIPAPVLQDRKTAIQQVAAAGGLT